VFLHGTLPYRPICFDLLLLKSLKVLNCLFLPPVDDLMRLRVGDFVDLGPPKLSGFTGLKC